MTDERQIEESIFLRAVQIPKLVDRAAFLEQICGHNEQMRAGVEALLYAHDKSGDLLDLPETFESTAEISEQPGTVIGPYKLKEKIGEGGMGVVFLAEQERPVRRRVALKIIKPGMDTRQVIGRFEAERQALAMMDHPNIAKVHDAGASEHGRSYFVMELVQGVPITEYCDQCNLTTAERLELFIAVCQAVQHAHQKGIIHRDIKPTNVLVSMQDGRPTPKVIDFGVAKAIDQKLTEQTLTTAFAQLLGSPLYMSPEQAELSPLGVDTRSDIYSLGVLLYELLVGATPFDKDRLHAATFDEFRRIIREEEPPRPSARLSTLSAELATTVAARHRTDVRQLEHTVRGELDWIVMKCLEKDRNRRYESAGSLARDVERYLHDEPVQACPPSAAYRFRKFARRNKTLLAAGGAIAAALFIGLGLSTWMYVRERAAVHVAKANEMRATTESARAKAVVGFLQEMLSSADATRAKGADYKVRDLLDDLSRGLGNQLAGQPEVEADIRATIGRAYRSLKLPSQAQTHFEKAIELRRHDPQPEKLADILVDYALNLHGQQRYSDAESRLNEALEIYRQRGTTGGPVIHALSALQHVLISSNRDVEAERVTEKALAIASQSSEEFPDQANLLHRYADLKIRQGHFAEAEQLAHQSVDMHHRVPGDQNPETAWALRTLATALQSQQKLDEAEPALHDSLAIFRRCYADDHVYVQWARDQLKTVLKERDDQAALGLLADEEAETAMRSNGPGNHAHLAGLLLTNNPSKAQKQEARRLVRWAVKEDGQVAVDFPDNLDRRIKAAKDFVELLRICIATPGFGGEVDELNRRLTAELPQLLAAFPDSGDCQGQTADIYSDWANGLLPYSNYLPTAEHAYRESIEIAERLSHSDSNRPRVWLYLANTYCWLGAVQWRSAKPEDAEAAYRRAMVIYDEHAAEIANVKSPYIKINDYLCFALYLVATHKEEEAAEVVRKAALDAKRITNPVELNSDLFLLALAQLRLGDEAGYRRTCRAMVDLPDDDNGIRKWPQVWSWCLAPDALDDLSLLVKRAEEFVANNSLDQRHFKCMVLGAALYRAGHYDRAADELKESIAAYPSDPPPGFDTINFQRLLLAMAKWQQGHKDEARLLFAETQPAIERELQTPSIIGSKRAGLEVLRREAEALIKPKEADEAMENVKPHPSAPNWRLTTE